MKSIGRAKQRSWVEISAAIGAVAISAASLFIAVRQNALMEKQLSASTWPVLEFGSSNVDDQGNPEISLEIRNAGIGPAKIRSFRLAYDGRWLTHTRQILEACCSGGQPLPKINLTTSGINHSVLAPNEKILFFRFKQTPDLVDYWRRLDAERPKVSVNVCYCSALNECWVLDSTRDEQERTNTCSNDGEQFHE